MRSQFAEPHAAVTPPFIDTPAVDLVHAALFFEHAGLGRALDNAVSLVALDGKLSVVLQLPEGEQQRVTPTPYASMQTLGEGFSLIDPRTFASFLRRGDFDCWRTNACSYQPERPFGLASLSQQEVLTNAVVFAEPAVMVFAKRRFPTRRTRETFGASDISSVIALAESENRRKQTGADDRTRKRQFVDIVRVVLKTPVIVGVSENCGKDSLPPSHVRNPGREPTQLQHSQAFPPLAVPL